MHTDDSQLVKPPPLQPCLQGSLCASCKLAALRPDLPEVRSIQFLVFFKGEFSTSKESLDPV